MRLGILLTTLALVAGTSSASYAARAPDDRPAVLQKAVIGHSVQGRPIKAFRLGERGAPKVLLIATMHGNEGAPRQILMNLRDSRPIHGLNLWVVPVYNPDGLAHNSRKNAHGVDLNRNYPYSWADLDGGYESGPRAGSEPETRAMMAFLKKIRPRWIISFHQPLDGVDTDTKDEHFAGRVSDKLNLPRKAFTCGGVCHGTMTGWYNHNFRGAAITVEYGAHPPRRLMQQIAPRQVLSIWGAHRR